MCLLFYRSLDPHRANARATGVQNSAHFHNLRDRSFCDHARSHRRNSLISISHANGIRCAACLGMVAVRHTARYLNRITSAIIAAAIEVHRILGPGLLESAYRKCLVVELQRAGFRCEQKRAVPLVYKGVRVGAAYEADLIVDGCVIVEVKAVDVVHTNHEQQLQTYLRLADCRVGLVLNFGGPTLKKGIKRVVNDFPDDNTESTS